MLKPSCLRWLKLLGFCVAISLLNLDFAFAQQPRNNFGAGQRNRPTTSPYLSMTDNGNGNFDESGLNYFNIVRPIQRGRKANQKIQNELQSIESNIGGPRGGQGSDALRSAPITTGRMAQTGHGAGFADLGGRFGGAGGAPAGRKNNFGSQSGGSQSGGGQNNFGSQPQQLGSGGLGIRNNMFGGHSTPNGILGGR